MLLRFAEQYLLARRFGPSKTLDAYFVAQVVIMVASQCAVAVTSAGVPIITARIHAGNQDVQEADFTIVACVLLVCIVSAVVLPLAAPLLVRLLGPGLDEGSRNLARFLLRCSVPAALLCTVAAALRAQWHARHDLLLPGVLQPLMPLISTCFAAGVAFDLLGIEWVPLGAGFGALLLALALAKPFFNDARSRAKLWSPAVAREFGSALFPVGLAMVLIPCMIAVGRVFASRLPIGNVSALSIAASLMSVPGQLAATSVGIAILPRTSAFFSNKQHSEAATLIERALRMTIFCAMPFSAVFALYPDRVVQIVFHGSSFNTGAVHLTSTALLGYSFGIPALGAMQVLVFALFASSAWRQVSGVTVLSLLVNILLSIFLSRSILGLSASFSTSCCISSAILTTLLKRYFTHLSAGRLLLAAGKAAVTAVSAFGVVHLLGLYLFPQPNLRTSLLLLAASLISYFGIGILVCRPEIHELVSLVRLNKKEQGTLVNDETTLVPGAS
jgi:putative peptidoglycan lipid II flippase